MSEAKQTETKTAAKTDVVAQEPASKGEVAIPAGMRLRLPYPKALGEYAGIDQRQWGVLIDAVWPNAKTVEAVSMAIAYCRSRNLDPMKKFVHIVPVWSKALGREIESVWPSIAEVRVTATRTGVYAGKDAAIFGPEVTKTFTHEKDGNHKEKTVTFPEWCRVDVYKIVEGIRCKFEGPKVVWEEAYATESKWSEIPNDMWGDRRSGQIEKCAEAASLRSAFPEELGNEYTAEEMHGRTVDALPKGRGVFDAGDNPTPPRPKESEFEREQTTATTRKKREPKNKPSANQVIDGEAKEVVTDKAAKTEEAPQPEETVLARGMRLLKTIKAEQDISDLFDSIMDELAGEKEEVKKSWRDHVAAHLKGIEKK